MCFGRKCGGIKPWRRVLLVKRDNRLGSPLRFDRPLQWDLHARGGFLDVDHILPVIVVLGDGCKQITLTRGGRDTSNGCGRLGGPLLCPGGFVV